MRPAAEEGKLRSGLGVCIVGMVPAGAVPAHSKVIEPLRVGTSGAFGGSECGIGVDRCENAPKRLNRFGPRHPPGVPFSGQNRPQPTFQQSHLSVNGIQFGLMGRW